MSVLPGRVPFRNRLSWVDPHTRHLFQSSHQGGSLIGFCTVSTHVLPADAAAAPMICKLHSAIVKVWILNISNAQARACR